MPLSELRCPECLRLLPLSRGLGHDRSPKTGDFTLCANCGALLRFGLLGFVRTTPDVLRQQADEKGAELLLKFREHVLARPRN
jgi:hypothetical protein